MLIRGRDQSHEHPSHRTEWNVYLAPLAISNTISSKRQKAKEVAVVFQVPTLFLVPI